MGFNQDPWIELEEDGSMRSSFLLIERSSIALEPHGIKRRFMD
jgi:hypothetical protein